MLVHAVDQFSTLRTLHACGCVARVSHFFPLSSCWCLFGQADTTVIGRPSAHQAGTSLVALSVPRMLVAFDAYFASVWTDSRNDWVTRKHSSLYSLSSLPFKMLKSSSGYLRNSQSYLRMHGCKGLGYIHVASRCQAIPSVDHPTWSVTGTAPSPFLRHYLASDAWHL